MEQTITVVCLELLVQMVEHQSFILFKLFFFNNVCVCTFMVLNRNYELN